MENCKLNAGSLVYTCYGKTGPTGPTGPTGSVQSLDSILLGNDGIITIASKANVSLGTIVNQTGSTISYTSPDSVILSPGTYLIQFSTLVANTSSSGDRGASLAVNGVIIPTASEYVSSGTSQIAIVLQHNITVNNTDKITIINASTVSNNYHDSSLSVLKIG